MGQKVLQQPKLPVEVLSVCLISGTERKSPSWDASV